MPTRTILSAFPSEVTERTLTFCHPYDVAAFSQTSRMANSLVYRGPKDQYLWRQLFLSYPFDDPRKSTHALIDPNYTVNLDWRAELQRRLVAEAVAFGREDQADERKDALETFIYVVQNALPVAAAHERQPSFNLLWVSNVLRESRILDSSCQHDERCLRAQLSSYLSLSPQKSYSDAASRLGLSSIRIKSRCFVYDLRNYRPESMYGPYEPGREGNINWVHVEDIINVIWMNLLELPLWIDTKPNIGLEATRAYSAPGTALGSEGRKDEDWAGVEGRWRRYVCFMDYR
jgi:hypothetical protein